MTEHTESLSEGIELAEQHDGDLHSRALEKATPRPERPGVAVIARDAFENPGFPPERPRVTDLDPKKDRQAERRVIWLFWISILGTALTIIAYIAFPIEEGDMGTVRLNNMLLGIGITLAMLGIGFGAVHWSKSLMDGHDLVEARHASHGSAETRAKAVEVFTLGNQESGFGRRALLRNTMIGALLVSPIPAIALFRDLAPKEDPVALLKHTMWEEGMRLARDPDGAPIRAADVTIGSVFHVIPEDLPGLEHHLLEEKAKAAVLLVRLNPADLNISPDRADWSYDGIVAYSKICTHVGCPVALYEQQTHHLLCPCHQSQFDIANEAKVIFGPAKRPLPQLPITVDAEGYLVARSDFHEPVGPSFWEREL